MPGLTHRHPPVRTAGGFTLLEVLCATILLALCLVPAVNALSGAVRAPADSAAAARNLDCVSSLMETVLAEPYVRLLAAASTGYPDPGAAGCPARKVVITRYGIESGRKIAAGNSDHLLSVSVGLANAADGNPFTLTTLVAR